MKTSDSIEAETPQQAPADILEKLFALQDKNYRAFQSKLMPTVPPETVIGVRTPLLRKLAKELSGTPQAESFLRCLPHTYYEENNLHAFLVERFGIIPPHWQKRNDFSRTLIIGPPVTVFAQRFLQSIRLS